MVIGNTAGNQPMYGLVFTNNMLTTGQYPVWNAGGGLHHVCYVVDNLEQALAGARAGSDCRAAAHAGRSIRRPAHRLDLGGTPSLPTSN
ncbi:MAG: hypothetical protein ABR920_01845 [Terriglobales bacterium]|jgi:hypothetical protein